MNFDIDLTGHEITRRAAVMAAIDWDPLDAFAAEAQAYRLLYSNLGEDQQKIFDELVAAGVLDASP